MGSSPQDSYSDRLSRADQWSSVLTGVSGSVILIAQVVFDEPWDDRVSVGAGLLTLLGLAVLGWGRRRQGVTDRVDLGPWRVGVRNVMYQSWVQADRSKTSVRAPLESIENLRQDLGLVGDDSWLHQDFHHATDLGNGEEFDLGDDGGPGGLWERLEGSYLIVGEAGSGKSVLVWQTLQYLIDTYDLDEVTPLLVEAFQWADFDNDPDGPVPRFEDFVAWRLQDPALGTPSGEAALLAGSVVLLLDGYDELVDFDPPGARRFLDSLGQARDSGRIDGRVVLTTRPAQYAQITAERGSGTKAVSYSVTVKPYPADKVVAVLENRDVPSRTLLDEVDRLDTVRELLRRPLWLSLAIELCEQQQPSPFAGLVDPTVEQCEAAMYRAWVNRVGTGRTDKWKQHVGYLASRMTTSTQTLTLEQIQGWWLPPHLHTRHKTLHALAAGLVFGLVGGLVGGLVDGLVDGMLLGLVFGVVGGLVFRLGVGLGAEPVANQRFDIRQFGLVGGLVGGLVVGVIFGLTGGLFGGLFGGFLVGMVYGLVDCFVATPASGPRSDTWSLLRSDLRAKAIRGLGVGPSIGLLVGLFFGPGQLPGDRGVTQPNDGLVGGLVFGLLFGLFFGLGVGLVFRLGAGLGAGLGDGLAGLHHLVARIIAAQDGLLPFKLGGLLDGLVTDGVMYRAGAGYRFRHRTLSYWLANEWHTTTTIDLTEEPTTQKPPATK